MEGEHGRILRFAVGPVYPNKSLTMYSSYFVFQKYKQDCAFRVTGVLQHAKTGPPVTKNFPLLRLFLSDAIMARKFYAPFEVSCTNLHIFTARRMSHFFDSNWPTSKLEKKIRRSNCRTPCHSMTTSFTCVVVL